MTKADFAILGSGAMGSIIGAHLARLYASASMRNFAGIDQIWGRYVESR
jgi:hypothetical protein